MREATNSGQLIRNDTPLMEPGHLLLIGLLIQASLFLCRISLSAEMGLIFKSNVLCHIALLEVLFSKTPKHLKREKHNF